MVETFANSMRFREIEDQEMRKRDMDRMKSEEEKDTINEEGEKDDE